MKMYLRNHDQERGVARATHPEFIFTRGPTAVKLSRIGDREIEIRVMQRRGAAGHREATQSLAVHPDNFANDAIELVYLALENATSASQAEPPRYRLTVITTPRKGNPAAWLAVKSAVLSAATKQRRLEHGRRVHPSVGAFWLYSAGSVHPQQSH